jgi:hypothetical protein
VDDPESAEPQANEADVPADSEAGPDEASEPEPAASEAEAEPEAAEPAPEPLADSDVHPTPENGSESPNGSVHDDSILRPVERRP